MLNNIKRFFQKKIPENILVLLTSQRSGSTWLFDTLRAHPQIEMLQSSVIFDLLDLNGRRYPIDLSGKTENYLNIEIIKRKWERIPKFTIQNNSDANQLIEPVWHIEKFHPHFFNFDSYRFIKNVERLSEKSNIKFIYNIRNPIDSLVSFLRYQARNPTWYAHVKGGAIIEHFYLEYKSILKILETFNGHVVTFEDIDNNIEIKLSEVLDILSLSQNFRPEDKIVEKMISATEKKTRLPKNKLFISEESSSNYNQKTQFKEFIELYKKEIKECQKLYSHILNNSKNSPESHYTPYHSV